MKNNVIYCDNNATTVVAPEVHEVMAEALHTQYGNPSSIHPLGLHAERLVKSARDTLAKQLYVKFEEVIFTSGGTESVNLAIKGAAHAYKRRGQHIITAPTEHEAVLESMKQLQQEGFEVSYAETDSYGRVSVDSVYEQLRSDTILVAIMHVNNELGSINPVTQIAKEVKAYNPAIITCVDGAQAFGKLDVNLQHIDLYAISGHKLHAPKGVGALITKDTVRLVPLLTGGGQELNQRSGTENVPGIIGLAKATQLAYDQLQTYQDHCQHLKTRFIEGLRQLAITTQIHSPEDGLPNTINVSFVDLPSEVLLNALENRGICVSAGSACGSSKSEHSHVLRAIGLHPKTIQSALRLSFSRYNTQDDIDSILKHLQHIVADIQTIRKES